MNGIPILYEEAKEMLKIEGFRELDLGTFVLSQSGSSPWFVLCPPDPDGYVDTGHVLKNISVAIPYIDTKARLEKRINQYIETRAPDHTNAG